MAHSKNIPQSKLPKCMGHMRFGTLSVAEPIALHVGCKEFDATKMSEQDIEWLDQNLEVAYNSNDNVKRPDIDVRNSKYTKAFSLDLRTDEVMNKMKMKNYYVKPLKLNLYKKGCFFSNNCDTDRTGLLGTLILILPSSHCGGELCVEEFNLDASQKQKDKDVQNKFRFVFFDSELDYSVAEVTEGYLITVIYSVYNDSTIAKPQVTFTEAPENWMLEALQYAHDFCSGKTNILFGKFKNNDDDAFNKIFADLSDKFDVAKVAVSEEDAIPIEDIEYVYTYDEEPTMAGYGGNFEDMTQEIYEVEHVLFESLCETEPESIDCDTTASKSLTEVEFKVKYSTAYLINPK